MKVRTIEDCVGVRFIFKNEELFMEYIHFCHKNGVVWNNQDDDSILEYMCEYNPNEIRTLWVSGSSKSPRMLHGSIHTRGTYEWFEGVVPQIENIE